MVNAFVKLMFAILHVHLRYDEVLESMKEQILRTSGIP